MTNVSDTSSEPIKGIKYCTRCCVPETQEGVEFDEMGICTACRSSEEKMHIDWTVREKQLRTILEEAKAKSGNGYDCVLPISGGKDSFFQAHVLVKVYGLKPLAVTFNQNWVSETGFYNLQRCLEVFDLDHLQFTPARSLVNRLAKKSLDAIGDACWHCHSGVGAFPLQVATRFKIPLLVWGESISENAGRASYSCPGVKFDRDYFTKVSAKLTAQEMTSAELSARDLHPFELPSYEEIEKTGVWGIHLGDYMFWDDERQTEWIREVYGWRETEMEGAYKGYKSAECIMAGVHDFTCYLKRGFGRSTGQASVDVRNGLLTRKEGFELIRHHDQERPEALDYYLKITGLSEAEFYDVMREKKLADLKTIDLPIHPKGKPNAERLVPFVEQIIQKHLHQPDPRVTRDQEDN
ncbi:N-acetyl sugar amidotransferase [Sulfuricella denitrificans skB26]|uniref:N-acetyl sugar amidotransferase n=1 Tax=Sulfuricella denitrificans (strain DSM 22764 / NBRC 105220 / skB26) TaxID=1163617 RepID=S6AP74_SULDS|nr:N-acetyl sugar amidotransferase [Sulfuricella denitrificans]BAN36694.1 N-acetyl sugar amidotransferase [Sulfuricella denitrificans skB26]